MSKVTCAKYRAAAGRRPGLAACQAEQLVHLLRHVEMGSTGIDHIWSVRIPVIGGGDRFPVHLGEAERVHGDDHHLAGPAECRQHGLVRVDLQELESPEHLGQPEISERPPSKRWI